MNNFGKQQNQKSIEQMLNKKPNFENDTNARINTIINDAISNSPDAGVDKILVKVERKTKKMGLSLDRQKLKNMIQKRIIDNQSFNL